MRTTLLSSTSGPTETLVSVDVLETTVLGTILAAYQLALSHHDAVRSRPGLQASAAVQQDGAMILIVVKYTVLPEYRDRWLPAVDSFTQAVRAEPGNLWFEWSVSADDPNQFVLVEGFRDAEAGKEHVEADYFAQAMELMPTMLAKTPEIINVEIPDRTGWSEMAELSVPDRT